MISRCKIEKMFLCILLEPKTNQFFFFPCYVILYLCMVVTPKRVVRSDLFCFLYASTLGKDRVRIFGKRSVDIPGLKSAIDIDVTEFSLITVLIDLSSALRTVTSDSFVVENYQVPFLRSKTRLKKTLIKVAYEPSVYERIQRQRKASSWKNYNDKLLCRTYHMSRKDVGLLDSHIRNKRTSCNLTAAKHEIPSYEIHGSHVFIDIFSLALSDVLQLIRAGKPNQLSQS